jgi:hypothetical protein
VVLGGTPGAISVHNRTTTPFTSGISQRQAATTGTAAPIVAFQLYGQNLQTIVPLERVLLVFATAPLAPGTPVERSPGLGLLVDVSGAHDRAVAYDINAGWSWGEAPWAHEVPAGAALAPVLITSPTP